MFVTLQWYVAQFQGLSSIKDHTLRENEENADTSSQLYSV